MNRLVRPCTGKSQLAPGADVLLRPPGKRFVPAQAAPGAGTLGTEDPIQLLQRQSGQGISAVEIDTDRRVPAGYIVAAGHGDDPERQIAELPLERQLLVPHDLAPHRSD